MKSLLVHLPHLRLTIFFGIFSGVAAWALLGFPTRALTSEVAGLGGDPLQTLWRFSVYAEALSRQSLLAVPEPFRNFSTLPWLPVHFLLGQPLAYNLVWILQAPLSVLAMLWLGRLLGLRPLQAALAGLLVAFAPYRVAQSLGHFGAMQLFWIPLALASALWWRQRPTPLRVVVSALIIVGAAWTEHVLFVMTLMALAVLILTSWKSFQSLRRSMDGRVLILLWILIILAGGVLPFTGELRTTVARESRLTPSEAQRTRFAPTLPSLFTLSRIHALRTTPSGVYGTPRATVADHVHALGIVGPLLIMTRLRHLWRNHRPLASLGIGITIVGIFLSLLPRIPGGDSIFSSLPVLSAVRTVDRFLGLAVIGLPLLALAAASAWRGALRDVLVALLILEVLPARFPLQSAAPPAYAAHLAHGRGPLLEVSSGIDYLVSSRALYASTFHGRAIVGHNAFERVEGQTGRQALLRLPGLRDLLLLRTEDLTRPTFFGQELRDVLPTALAREQIRTIVVHNSVVGLPVLRYSPRGVVAAVPPDLEATHRFLKSLGLSSTMVDEETTLYTVPAWSETGAAGMALRGEGWERSVRRPDGTVQTALRSGARFSLLVPGSVPVDATLSLQVAPSAPLTVMTLEGPRGSQRVQVHPGEALRVPLGVLTRGEYSYVVSLDTTELIIENPSVTFQAT